MSSKQTINSTEKKQKPLKIVKHKMEKEEPEVKISQKTVLKKENNKNTEKDIKKESKKDVKKESKEKDEEETMQKSKFEIQIQNIKEEIKSVKIMLRTLDTNLKNLENVYNQDIKNAKKTAKKQKREKKSGIVKPKIVPDKLADFIEVQKGSELTRTDVAKKVWEQLRKRGLISDDDKRVFKTDKVITDLFGVPTSVNKIKDCHDKKGFNFYNLQSYIKNAYLES